MAKSITLKGTLARLFIAEALVEEHGEKARENCEGPALAAVEAVLERKKLECDA